MVLDNAAAVTVGRLPPSTAGTLPLLLLDLPDEVLLRLLHHLGARHILRNRHLRAPPPPLSATCSRLHALYHNPIHTVDAAHPHTPTPTVTHHNPAALYHLIRHAPGLRVLHLPRLPSAFALRILEAAANAALTHLSFVDPHISTDLAIRLVSGLTHLSIFSPNLPVIEALSYCSLTSLHLTAVPSKLLAHVATAIRASMSTLRHLRVGYDTAEAEHADTFLAFLGEAHPHFSVLETLDVDMPPVPATEEIQIPNELIYNYVITSDATLAQYLVDVIETSVRQRCMAYGPDGSLLLLRIRRPAAEKFQWVAYAPYLDSFFSTTTAVEFHFGMEHLVLPAMNSNDMHPWFRSYTLDGVNDELPPGFLRLLRRIEAVHLSKMVALPSYMSSQHDGDEGKFSALLSDSRSHIRSLRVAFAPSHFRVFRSACRYIMATLRTAPHIECLEISREMLAYATMDYFVLGKLIEECKGIRVIRIVSAVDAEERGPGRERWLFLSVLPRLCGMLARRCDALEVLCLRDVADVEEGRMLPNMRQFVRQGLKAISRLEVDRPHVDAGSGTALLRALSARCERNSDTINA